VITGKLQGDKPIDIKVIKRTSALNIRGIYLNKIKYCSDIFQNSNYIIDYEEVLALRNPILSAWRQAGGHHTKYPTSESAEQVFMITSLWPGSLRRATETQWPVALSLLHLLTLRIHNATVLF